MYLGKGLKRSFSVGRCQAVGVNLRTLIQSVDEILPTLHSSVRNEVGLLGGAVEELLLALLMED